MSMNPHECCKRKELKLTHGKVEEQVIQLCCIKYKQSSLERAEQSLELSAEKRGGDSLGYEHSDS
jgi:hypothetical protein